MKKSEITATLNEAKALGLDTTNIAIDELPRLIRIKKGEATPEDVAGIEVPKDFKMPVGRPVETGSERQKRLAAMQAKKDAGMEVKRGRPVEMDSERQQQLKEKKERQAEVIAAGGSIHRGRPTDPNSPRQKQLAEKEAKRKAYFLNQLAGTDVTATLAASGLINSTSEINADEVDADVESEA